MPLLTGNVQVEFYKGHPLRPDRDLLEPWVEERHTVHAALYGDVRSTFQLRTTIEKDHLDQVTEFVDFATAIKNLVNAIGTASTAPNPKSVVRVVLETNHSYDQFKEFVDTFRPKEASGIKCLDIVYPNHRFDSLLLRFQAASVEDELPDQHWTTAPRVSEFSPAGSAESITFGRPLFRMPSGDGPKFEDVTGRKWDQFRQVEYVVDFRRLEQEFGDGMYGELSFAHSIGMRSVVGNLGLEQVFVLNIVRPPRPVVIGFTPRTEGAGSSVTIHGEHLFSAREVRFGNHPSPEFTQSDELVTAVVPQRPPNDPGELDPITIRTAGGTSVRSPGDFKIVRRLEQVRSAGMEEGRVFEVGDVVEIEGVHLREVNHIEWASSAALANRVPATWRPIIERNRDLVIQRERLMVAVPDGLSGLATMILTTPTETKSLGAFLIQALPTIGSVTQLGVRGDLAIRGKNFEPLETVFFGTAKAEVLSSSDTSLTVRVPGKSTEGVPFIVEG